jgi:hypothetical protein
MPSVEKTTDVSHSAPFAYGILYPIVGYTLDDLEKLGDQLRAIPWTRESGVGDWSVPG